MGLRSKIREGGMSLAGFIFLLMILGVIGVLAMKVVPTVSEYFSVKKAIVEAKNRGATPVEIRQAFDRQADVGYITSVSGRDLNIIQQNGGYEVSFAYEKVIPLGGPASLLIEYEGSTANGTAQRRAVP